MITYNFSMLVDPSHGSATPSTVLNLLQEISLPKKSFTIITVTQLFTIKSRTKLFALSIAQGSAGCNGREANPFAYIARKIDVICDKL